MPTSPWCRSRVHGQVQGPSSSLIRAPLLPPPAGDGSAWSTVLIFIVLLAFVGGGLWKYDYSTYSTAASWSTSGRPTLDVIPWLDGDGSWPSVSIRWASGQPRSRLLRASRCAACSRASSLPSFAGVVGDVHRYGRRRPGRILPRLHRLRPHALRRRRPDHPTAVGCCGARPAGRATSRCSTRCSRHHSILLFGKDRQTTIPVIGAYFGSRQHHPASAFVIALGVVVDDRQRIIRGGVPLAAREGLRRSCEGPRHAEQSASSASTSCPTPSAPSSSTPRC